MPAPACNSTQTAARAVQHGTTYSAAVQLGAQTLLGHWQGVQVALVHSVVLVVVIRLPHADGSAGLQRLQRQQSRAHHGAVPLGAACRV